MRFRDECEEQCIWIDNFSCQLHRLLKYCSFKKRKEMNTSESLLVGTWKRSTVFIIRKRHIWCKDAWKIVEVQFISKWRSMIIGQELSNYISQRDLKIDSFGFPKCHFWQFCCTLSAIFVFVLFVFGKPCLFLKHLLICIFRKKDYKTPRWKSLFYLVQ